MGGDQRLGHQGHDESCNTRSGRKAIMYESLLPESLSQADNGELVHVSIRQPSHRACCFVTSHPDRPESHIIAGPSLAEYYACIVCTCT